MNAASRPIRLALVAAILSILAGCLGGSVPVRFWVLNAMPGDPAEQEIQRSVAVGPVLIPEYLDRREVVRRLGPNRLDVAEFDQWGHALEDQVGSVLARNLEILVPGTRAAPFPWRESTPPDLELAVHATRFELDADGSVHLDAGWKLVRTSPRRTVANGYVRLREPIEGGGFDDIAAAMSRALEALARKVAPMLSD